MLSINETMIVIVLIGLLSISPILAIKKKLDGNKEPDMHKGEVDYSSGGSYDYPSNAGNEQPLEQKAVSSTQKTSFLKSNKLSNLIPILVLAISAFYIFWGGDIFGSSNPEGRWYYYMETGDGGDGIINNTEYWYMDITSDGTLDVGWKNIGYSEDSEGWGTWYLQDGIVYLEIHYDYGETFYGSYYITGGKFYDSDTNVYSGWEKD